MPYFVKIYIAQQKGLKLSLGKSAKIMAILTVRYLFSISLATTIQYFSCCIYSVFLMPSTDLSYFVLPCPVSSSVGSLSQHRPCPSIHTLIHSTQWVNWMSLLFGILKAQTKLHIQLLYICSIVQCLLTAYTHTLNSVGQKERGLCSYFCQDLESHEKGFPCKSIFQCYVVSCFGTNTLNSVGLKRVII